MKTQTVFLMLTGTALVLHLVWETLHLPLYTNYAGISGGMPVPLYAAFGDVLYTLGAVLFVALYKKKLLWFKEATASDYEGLAILGFFIALFVEYKALALHRWAYTAAMPTLLGVGLSPLLQMTLLLPLSVFLTTRWASCGTLSQCT